MAKKHTNLAMPTTSAPPVAPEVEQHHTSFPTGTIDMVGSVAGYYKSSVTRMDVFDKHPRGGEMQLRGTADILHEQAQRGWQSYAEPVGRAADPSETKKEGDD